MMSFPNYPPTILPERLKQMLELFSAWLHKLILMCFDDEYFQACDGGGIGLPGLGS